MSGLTGHVSQSVNHGPGIGPEPAPRPSRRHRHTPRTARSPARCRCTRPWTRRTSTRCQAGRVLRRRSCGVPAHSWPVAKSSRWCRNDGRHCLDRPEGRRRAAPPTVGTYPKAANWLGWHHRFGPAPGSDPKIADPLGRYGMAVARRRPVKCRWRWVAPLSSAYRNPSPSSLSISA